MANGRWLVWTKTVWSREEWAGNYAGGRVVVYLSAHVENDVVVRCNIGVHGTDDGACWKDFGGDFEAARRLAQSICDGITGDELAELGFEFNGHPFVATTNEKDWERWDTRRNA